MTVDRQAEMLRALRAALADLHEVDPDPVDGELERLLDEIEQRLMNRRTVQ